MNDTLARLKRLIDKLEGTPATEPVLASDPTAEQDINEFFGDGFKEFVPAASDKADAEPANAEETSLGLTDDVVDQVAEFFK